MTDGSALVNPYEPPVESTVRHQQTDSPFFGWPVAAAAVLLGLLTGSIFVTAVLTGQPVTATIAILGVSISAGFLLVGIGSFKRSRKVFHSGFAFFFVWVSCLLKLWLSS